MLDSSSSERTPIILLDNLGYGLYKDSGQRPFLHADRYDVRLVTDLAKIAEANGSELESVVGVTLSDEQSLQEAVEFQYRAGGRPAAGIVAISESLLLPAARLREEFALPGPTVADTLRFRDKIIMKERLSGNGIRVPEFAQFSVAAAHQLLRRHARLIVKPRLGAGSIGVSALCDYNDVVEFADANEGWLDEFEVEEFIDGPLYHVDSVVERGRVVAATAGQSVDSTTSFKDLRPYRDIGLGEGATLRSLLEFNQAVLAGFPDFTGVTHHEIFLSGGEPVFCEIAARAGGGGVVAGFRSRTDVDLHDVALRALVTGRVPASLRVAGHLTGYVLIYAGDGVLRKPFVPLAEPWVVEAKVNAQVGERLSRAGNWADWVAMVLVRGDTEEMVAARLDEVVERMRPDLEPHRAVRC
jgi:biotin carboxylase